MFALSSSRKPLLSTSLEDNKANSLFMTMQAQNHFNSAAVFHLFIGTFHSCDCDVSTVPRGNLLKLGTNVHLDSGMN